MIKKRKTKGYSRLIEDFFEEINYTPSELRGIEVADGDQTRINKQEPPECSPTVAKIAEALDAIVNAAQDADQALGIEGLDGRISDEYSRHLTWKIRKWLENDNWPVVTVLANEWLKEHGYSELTEDALKKRYARSDAKRGSYGSLDSKDMARQSRRR